MKHAPLVAVSPVVKLQPVQLQLLQVSPQLQEPQGAARVTQRQVQPTQHAVQQVPPEMPHVVLPVPRAMQLAALQVLQAMRRAVLQVPLVMQHGELQAPHEVQSVVPLMRHAMQLAQQAEV